MARAKFADTMIGSPDIKKTAAFYKATLKLKLADKGDGSFLILKDPETGQRLCIVTTPKASKNAGIGVETKNLAQTLASLEKRGCKVTARWEYPKMIGANCTDIDGHEMLLWQTLKTAKSGASGKAKAKTPAKTPSKRRR
jgi:hypothetical protein